MLKKLNWQAYTGRDRNEVIEAIKTIIIRNDGSILNFNMFSDLALSLSIEIGEGNISGLYEELRNVIGISEAAPELLSPHSRREWLILMNISFTRGKGNLKVDIPEVPG